MKSGCILITSFRSQKAAKQSRPIYRCYAQNAMGLRALKHIKKIPSKNEIIAATEADFCGREGRHISAYFSNTPGRLFRARRNQAAYFSSECARLCMGRGGRIKTISGVIDCFFRPAPAIMMPQNEASLGERSKWQVQNHG